MKVTLELDRGAVYVTGSIDRNGQVTDIKAQYISDGDFISDAFNLSLSTEDIAWLSEKILEKYMEENGHVAGANPDAAYDLAKEEGEI